MVRVSTRSRPPLSFIPTLIGLRAFDLVSSRVWWEAATNIGSHCTKWADEQHSPAGFESRLTLDLPLPFIPTLISLWAFDHVSSRVWWEAAINKQTQPRSQSRTQSRFCLSESLPRALIFLIVKLGRGFSLLSLVYVLFAFNIFLITYFCVVSSFEPPPLTTTVWYLV